MVDGTEHLSDAEFRETYAPLIGHFVGWRTRLNTALNLDPLGSMEHAVARAEELTAVLKIEERHRRERDGR